MKEQLTPQQKIEEALLHLTNNLDLAHKDLFEGDGYECKEYFENMRVWIYEANLALKELNPPTDDDLRTLIYYLTYDNPMDMIMEASKRHKAHYDSIYRIILSQEHEETMQYTCGLMIEGEEVIIGYSPRLDRSLVRVDTVKKND